MENTMWHYVDGVPFNHPAIIDSATTTFTGKRIGLLTMSQLCFTTAVVSFIF